MPVVSCGMYTANPARNRPVVAPKCFLHWSRDCCSFQQGGFGHSMQRGLSPMHYCIDRIHKTHAVRSRAETCILVQALSMWERMWCHDRACVCTFDIASDVTPQVLGCERMESMSTLKLATATGTALSCDLRAMSRT